MKPRKRVAVVGKPTLPQYEIIVRYEGHKQHPFVWMAQRKTYSLIRARQIADTFLRPSGAHVMIRPEGFFKWAMS